MFLNNQCFTLLDYTLVRQYPDALHYLLEYYFFWLMQLVNGLQIFNVNCLFLLFPCSAVAYGPALPIVEVPLTSVQVPL